MGKAIVVVLPDALASAPDDVVERIAADVGQMIHLDGERLQLDASVIGWPPDMGEIVSLLDPT